MAKFCANCGKELVDGKCPVCKDSPKTEKKESSKFNAGDCVNAFVEMIQKMITAPKDTIQKYAKEKYFTYGLIAMAVSCILTGAFGYLLTQGILSSLLSMVFGSYSGLLNYDLVGTSFKIFLTMAIYAAVGFAVIIGMIYIMVNVAFKKEVNTKKVVASFGPVAIFNTMIQIVCIICYYLSTNLMTIVFLIGNLCYMVYMIQAIKIATDVDDNKLAYTYVPALTVASFVVIYVLPRLFN